MTHAIRNHANTRALNAPLPDTVYSAVFAVVLCIRAQRRRSRKVSLVMTHPMGAKIANKEMEPTAQETRRGSFPARWADTIMWITWKHQDADLNWPLTFETKVELFCEQALGWQLHIADLVAKGGTAFGEGGNRQGDKVAPIRHSGFAVLQICLSYFETVGHYTAQPRGSKEAFRAGVLHVFPDLAKADSANQFIDVLYRDARCGLYHNVRTARVGLAKLSDEEPIAYDEQSKRVVIYPEGLPAKLKVHLGELRKGLLDESNTDLRQRFERKFDEDSGDTVNK